MKIAAAEAQWNTCEPSGFSLFQIGGFSAQDPNPSFSITVPRLLSFLATGSFNGQVQGINQLQAQEQKDFGQGNYIPRVRLIYWSMRVMALLGVAMFLIAAVGAWLYRKRRLEKARWFLWTAVIAIAFPFIAATVGWILTEIGRQPWIVQGLLKTSDANSPSVSTAMVASSIGVFALLYIVLGVVDFVLMRRYARIDPPALRRGERGSGPGAELLGADMDLETIWFVLIAVLWSGYFLLEGFDFGVGMLLPFLPRDEARAQHDVRVHRPRLGRQRGVAGDRRRRDLRRVPRVVRDDVLGLLPRAAAHPRPAHRARGLLRVARAR